MLGFHSYLVAPVVLLATAIVAKTEVFPPALRAWLGLVCVIGLVLVLAGSVWRGWKGGNLLSRLTGDFLALAAFILPCGGLEVPTPWFELKLGLVHWPIVYFVPILGVAYLIHRGSYRARLSNPVRNLLIVFWVSVLVSTLFSVRRSSANNEFVAISIGLGVFLIAAIGFDPGRTGRSVWVGFTMGFGVLLAVSLADLASGSPRPFGTMTHPNHLAAFIVLALPFHLTQTTRAKFPPLRIGAAVLATGGLVVLVNTGSRGGHLAFVLLLVFWMLRWKEGRFLPALLLAGFAAAAILWPKGASRWATLPNDFQSGMLRERLLIWHASLTPEYETWRMLVGFGPGHSVRSLFAGSPVASMGPTLATVAHAHSVFVQFLVSTGVLGLVAFVSLVIAVLTEAGRRAEEDRFATVRLGLFLGMVGFLAHGVVDNVLEQEGALAFWMVLGLLVSLARQEKGGRSVQQAFTPSHTPRNKG